MATKFGFSFVKNINRNIYIYILLLLLLLLSFVKLRMMEIVSFVV